MLLLSLLLLVVAAEVVLVVVVVVVVAVAVVAVVAVVVLVVVVLDGVDAEALRLGGARKASRYGRFGCIYIYKVSLGYVYGSPI